MIKCVSRLIDVHKTTLKLTPHSKIFPKRTTITLLKKTKLCTQFQLHTHKNSKRFPPKNNNNKTTEYIMQTHT